MSSNLSADKGRTLDAAVVAMAVVLAVAVAAEIVGRVGGDADGGATPAAVRRKAGSTREVAAALDSSHWN